MFSTSLLALAAVAVPQDVAVASAQPLAEPVHGAAVLLVTSDELAGAWQDYAEWKTSIGKPTKILTVTHIAENYEAENVQEAIRLCVRDHIDNHGTQWVVLGGDSLPGGKGHVPGGHTTVHAQERAGIPTDIIYLSPTNWDADGDGVYGEFEDDRAAITYPDGSVGLGRVPVRTAADVAAFTDKVIAYEADYPTSDYATQMIYTCTDQPAYPKVRNSWDGYLSEAWAGGQMGRFFSMETPWDGDGEPGNYPLSADNLVGLFNGKTTSKMHIHGHGHLPAWLLEEGRFTAEHVGKLSNTGAYPLITTVSCNTGEYDSEKDPSVVESMIRAPRAGSVAVVAPIRTGKPHFHDRSDFRLMVSEGKLDGTTQTMTRYWVNGLGGGMTTGQAFMTAKAQMASDAERTAGYHLCISEINLLGDPTLDMRATSPMRPTLEMPKAISTGPRTLTVSTGAPGSTVCAWMGEDVYAVATADDAGVAKLQVAPTTAGGLRVSVSGASLNATAGVISVTDR